MSVIASLEANCGFMSLSRNLVQWQYGDASSAKMHHYDIYSHPVKPGSECCFATKATYLQEYSQKYFLRKILGIEHIFCLS